MRTTTTAARTAARAATRPNALTRFGMRLGFAGFPCSTCGLPVAQDGWTARAGVERPAGSQDIGHREDVALTGSWSPQDCGPQCHACNQAARRAGVQDQSSIWQCAPWSPVSRPVAQAARATFVAQSAAGLPDAAARKAARAARGAWW